MHKSLRIATIVLGVGIFSGTNAQTPVTGLAALQATAASQVTAVTTSTTQGVTPAASTTCAPVQNVASIGGGSSSAQGSVQDCTALLALAVGSTKVPVDSAFKKVTYVNPGDSYRWGIAVLNPNTVAGSVVIDDTIPNGQTLDASGNATFCPGQSLAAINAATCVTVPVTVISAVGFKISLTGVPAGISWLFVNVKKP